MQVPPKNLWIYVVTLVVAVVALRGCTKAPPVWDKVPGGPTKVLVTIPPLYSFAKNVAGDDAAVLGLLTTQGPHDAEPNRMDTVKAGKANLFISVGLDLDELFVTQTLKNSGNEKIEVVELGEKALEPKNMLLASNEHDEHDEHEAKEKDGHHHHGKFDPHVWLGIDQAVVMVDYLGTTFQKIDPTNKDKYAKRTEAYKKELKDLKQEGLNEFKAKKNKRLIAMHDSLRYFAQSFGLEIVGSIQPRPGVEADASKLKELARLCKEKDVRVIAVEPQFQIAAAEVLRNHLKGKGIEVELVTVDPMETVMPAELDAGYYVRTMRKNVKNLAEKLP